jgi:hypothetical protein
MSSENCLGPNNTNSSTLNINIPKHLGIYYGWPSLVQGANGNLSSAIVIFNQFDLIVFGDGIASPSHGDHNINGMPFNKFNSNINIIFNYTTV